MQSQTNNDGKWVLVYTKPNQELLAKRNLDNQDFFSLLPIVNFIKEDDTSYNLNEVLFPRYIFVRIDLEKQDWLSIKSTRGVSHIVSFGNKLAEVPSEFIDKLCDITDENGNLYQVLDKSSINHGDQVSVKDGIFKDKKATFIDYRSKNRAKILIDVINRKISVDILISSIVKKIPDKKIAPI
tara:strand:+ start:880 stop:1428 length:549 start_codon:yes stop_codon:yes gene_type:complete